MVARLTWATGVSGLLLALARVGRLLDFTDGGATVFEHLAVAAALGMLVTIAANAARAPSWAMVLLNVVGAVVVGLRRISADSLIAGFLPTQDTMAVAAEQGRIALQLIRFGAAPVVAVAGVVALLSLLFWGLGAAVAHGSTRRLPGIAVVPPLVVYLQFATFDRRPPGPWWTAAFLMVSVAALAITAPALRTTLGRARFTGGGLVPIRSGGLLAVLAIGGLFGGLVASSVFAATVAESGLLSWRTDTGIGAGLYGGGSPNVFVGLQQQLVDLSDEPVFYARFSENAPPNRDLYWKLVTLDRYDGQFWTASTQTFAAEGRSRWERDDWSFRGPTVRISANVAVADLRGSFLPAVYSPVDLTSDEPLIRESFRVREDGSIALDVQPLPGWTYQVQADVPRPDLGLLASEDGVLTPLFDAAVREGRASLTPATARTVPRPASIDPYVELPDDVVRDVAPLADEIADAGSTDFERALLLESFFRDPAEFTYSTEVDTGHTTLDLVEWITDPDSVNFRTGYCEQFATAMGVMGRALGIPSRVVVGFTPGEAQPQEDGSELIVVRERNAHAWVEMWMDGQGWVRFDPTPRSDRINPSLGADDIGFDARSVAPQIEEQPGEAASSGAPLIPDRLLEDRGGEAVPDFGDGTDGGLRIPREVASWIGIGLALVFAVGLAPTVKLLRRRSRISRIRKGDVDAAWREIVDRLVDLGSTPAPVDTPTEIAHRSGDALVPLADRYNQVAYGGRTTVACVEEFVAAEDRLREDHQGHRWWVSWLSPRSLFRR